MSTEGVYAGRCPWCDSSHCADWTGAFVAVETVDHDQRSKGVCQIRKGENDGQVGHGKELLFVLNRKCCKIFL